MAHTGSTKTSPISHEHVRRSFVLAVLNGALFRFSLALVDPALVLTWFVSELTTSGFLVGLVSPLASAGWFLPQMFVSGYLQRRPHKLPFYIVTGAVRLVCWATLTALTWFVSDRGALLVAFFTLYPLAQLAAGLAGIPFFDVIAKTIPATRRGSLFAWRQLLGGLLAIAAGWVVNQALNGGLDLPFPCGYALLLTVATGVIALALTAFALIPEPEGEMVEERVRLGEQVRRGWSLVNRDVSFRRYLVARAALMFGEIALPFYVIFAKEVLGAGVEMIGVYLITTQATALTTNLLWGRLSDRHGNRLVLRLIAAGKAGVMVLVLGLSVLVPGTGLDGLWLPYLILPVFALEGALRPAGIISGSNLLLEIAPPVERPVYLGFANTVLGLTLLATGVGGLVVDRFGFEGLFALALACEGLAFVFSMRLCEPRGGENGQ